MAKPVIIVTLQRHRGDCAIAALASLLRIPYEEVLVAAAQLKPTVLVNGLDNDEIVRVAQMFGRNLVERTGDEIDYRQSTGILGGHRSIEPPEDEHAVVLSSGLVFDPDSKGEVWRVRDYIRHFKMDSLDLLELDD